MARKYRHIKDYDKELIEYIEQGHTLRETGEKFGFKYQEMRDFKARYNNYRIQTKTKLTPLEKRNQFVA